MRPHNHILRKYTGGYKLYKSQEKIYHLKYMDDIKLFVNKEIELELETLIQALRIYSEAIWMEFGVEKWTMQMIKSKKQQMLEVKELPNEEKFRMCRRA